MKHKQTQKIKMSTKINIKINIKFKRFICIVGIILVQLYFAACSSAPVDGEGGDQDSENQETVSESENSSDAPVENNASSNDTDSFDSFDDEPGQAPEESAQQAPPPDGLAPESEPLAAPQELPAPVAIDNPPSPEPLAPPPPPTPNDSMSLTKIRDIRFVPNSVGGSIVIEANGPMTFTENLNPQTQKLLVEIPNARFGSGINPFQQVSDATESIESIETSQNGNTAQVIVQIGKSGARPTLQQEGNSLLVIAKGQPPPSSPSGDGGGLNDFFGANHKFYGKKISMEVSDMDLKDVLSFVAAESGINLVMSDAISGKISLKLRQVPWDQALVMIMGTKELGYVRQGNIIRIVPIKNLQEEEKAKQEVLRLREDSSPLVVRTFPLNYAKPEDIGKVAKPFLTQRGKDNVEPRSNSLVITDIQEVVDRIARMIPALDISPPQVLIEGKLVEAQEKFTRELGLRWGLNAQPMNVGSAGAQLNSNLSVSPQGSSGSGVFNYNLNVGTLDVLGDLNAFLSLSESEENVKVISSPRVLTLHNEQAVISQSTEIPLIGSTVQTTGAISKSVTFKEISLQLKVTPTVSTDGTIILLVEVNRSFVAGKADPETNASPINNRTAKTKVIVRNGQTAVIGGIYQSDATEIERGVPGLSSIPVLGSLFKYKYKSKDKNELLVFLTPRIMGKDEFMAGGGDGTEF